MNQEAMYMLGILSLPFLYLVTPIGFRAMVILIGLAIFFIHPALFLVACVLWASRRWIAVAAEIFLGFSLARRMGLFDSPERAQLLIERRRERFNR